MSSDYSTTPVVNTWSQCYTLSWQGLCVPETMAHPAKYSVALIRRIMQHIGEEGWIEPGGWILDPFGGVGLGGRAALEAGYHFLANELEPHFVDIGRGCDCTGLSKEAWVRFYGRARRVSHSEDRHYCPRCLSQASQVIGNATGQKRTFRTKPPTGPHVMYTTQVRQGDGSLAWRRCPAYWSEARRPAKRKTGLFQPLPFPDRRDGVRSARVLQQSSLLVEHSAAYTRNSGILPATTPHHYEGNTELWARQGLGKAVLLQGDSRRLQEVIQAQVDVVAGSPPYANGLGHAAEYRSADKYAADAARDIMQQKGGQAADMRYSANPNNLGNLPPGSLDALISSPPYSGNSNHDYRITDEGGQDRDMRRGYRQGLGCFRGSETYGQTAGNLGAMEEGHIETVVASPPYANGCAHTGGADPQPQHIQGGELPYVAYGSSAAQLGNMPAGQVECTVASPPWDDGAPALAPDRQRATSSPKDHGGPGPQYVSMARLGEPDTFWSAARQIIAATYALLKPGGHAVWIVKNYIRDGREIPFTEDWAKLCEACGFRLLHHHKASLIETHGMQHGLFGEDTVHETRRESFFRRLARKKTGLSIDYESVLCMVKLGGDGNGVDCTVSSPPYAETIDRDNKQGMHYRLTAGGNFGQSLRAMADTAYGTTPGQHGAMPPGARPC